MDLLKHFTLPTYVTIKFNYQRKLRSPLQRLHKLNQETQDLYIYMTLPWHYTTLSIRWQMECLPQSSNTSFRLDLRIARKGIYNFWVHNFLKKFQPVTIPETTLPKGSVR